MLKYNQFRNNRDELFIQKNGLKAKYSFRKTVWMVVFSLEKMLNIQNDKDYIMAIFLFIQLKSMPVKKQMTKKNKY